MVAQGRYRGAPALVILLLAVLLLPLVGTRPAHPTPLTAAASAPGRETSTRIFGWPTGGARAAAGTTFPVLLKVDGPVGRSVRLQALVGGTWKTQRLYRTSAAGAATVRVPVGKTARQWRVWVPPAPRFPAAISAARTFSSKSGQRASAQPKRGSLGTWLAANRQAAAGARLPSSARVANQGGRVYYVAANGSNRAAGKLRSPLRTLHAAVARVHAGEKATIVVRGGTYSEGQLVVPKGRGIRIVAYPGEVPVFDGSTLLESGWVTSGGLASHAYTPRPVENGSGIAFKSGQNLTGVGIGKHPDQAWSGNVELRQVATKAAVVPGTFWVDRTGHRLYVAQGERSWAPISVSHHATFVRIQGSGSSVEGLRIRRYSNPANAGGVIGIAANRVVLRNVEITGASFQAVQLGGSVPVSHTTMERVTIADSNWMGVSATYATHVAMNRLLIGGLNQFGEFSASPQSGALKTSRSRHLVVRNSVIADNRSYGLWFDQSTVNVDLVRNRITGNSGSGVFFEISDDLLMVDNYIRGKGQRAVLLSGSSGLKLVNNTVVGGASPLVVSTDLRSRPGCADPRQPLCTGSMASDRDTLRPRPAALDWMPRIDLMLNNVIAHPAGSDWCGVRVPMCITLASGSARTTLNAVIHRAHPARGIPATVMNGNVYVSASREAVRTSNAAYPTAAALGKALRAAPFRIAGAESRARSGARWVTADGRPTGALKAAHKQAARVPKNAELNRYIPAGTARYGAVW